MAKVTTRAVADSLAGTDMVGTPDVGCAGRTNCGIRYEVEETTGISTDKELIEPTRQIWATLFADPQFKRGVITVEGQTTTEGGKSDISPLFTLACDRTAANQIDWDQVQGKGMRSLCDYQPKVSGL